MKWSVALSILLCLSGCGLPEGPGRRDFESSKHTLVQAVGPGQGMRRVDKFLTVEQQPAELVWLTGASLGEQCDDPTVKPVLSQASIVLKNIERYEQLHDLPRLRRGTLFRFSPSHTVTKFPDGFAIPINSNEPWLLGTESQCSVDPAKPVTASFGGRLEFTRQRGLSKEFVPLSCVQLDGISSNFHGPVKTDGSFARSRELAKGEHILRAEVTSILALERDTMLHYVTGHLPASGTSLELYDTTARRRVVLLSREKGPAAITPWSSSEGVRLEEGHRYELIATFQNPSAQPVRVGAEMLLYLRASEKLDTPK